MKAKTEEQAIIPSEHQEQRAFVQWLEYNNYKFTSIPNSTFSKSWKQKLKNKVEGLRAGLPDLLIIKNNKLIFIEMKRSKKTLSKVSSHQAQWIKALNDCEGVKAFVAYGCDHAINLLKI